MAAEGIMELGVQGKKVWNSGKKGQEKVSYPNQVLTMSKKLCSCLNENIFPSLSLLPVMLYNLFTHYFMDQGRTY